MDLTEYIESLRPALTEVASEQELAEADMEAARQRVLAAKEKRRRIERAMAELGESQRAKRKTATHVYPPSRKTQERVLALINNSSEGVTAASAKEKLDLSDSTVNRCLRVLRDNGEIRFAGKRGAADLYKPVMSHAEPVATH